MRRNEVLIPATAGMNLEHIILSEGSHRFWFHLYMSGTGKATETGNGGAGTALLSSSLTGMLLPVAQQQCPAVLRYLRTFRVLKSRGD